MTALDQLFVNLKHALVGWFPERWQPLAAILLSIVPLMMVFPGLFALTTLLERKGLGRIQNRFGPNRVGPFGLLQPLADGLKMLTKEDIVPRAADKAVHFLAPFVLLVPVFLALAVIPYGRNMVAVELDGGLLFFFAVGAATELSVFMAGWASHNKYSLLGALRSIAQMISYELPLVLSALTVVMLAGTLSLQGIIDAQSPWLLGFLPAWFVFTPWGVLGFLLFIVAGLAESNRTPFDIPEAESEIIAGYLVEYSGFKYALFFLGEYLGLFAISGLAVTLFLGGWLPPFSFLDWVPSWIWFFVKLFLMIALFIWVRGTLPRLRSDQLMNFAWKFILPLSLINLVVAAIWHYSRSWNLPGGVIARWLLCGALVATAYVGLAQAQTPRFRKRVYRYAS